MKTRVFGRIVAACVVMSSIFGRATGDLQPGVGSVIGGMGSGKGENQYCAWEFDSKTNTLGLTKNVDGKCSILEPKGELFFGELGEQKKVTRFHSVEFETKDFLSGWCYRWIIDSQGHARLVRYAC
jgi:hypothetical protein